MPSETINTNHLSVTRDEATEFCAHHIRLAALFFESMPEGTDAHNEVYRILASEERALIAAQALIPALDKFYEDMKAND